MKSAELQPKLMLGNIDALENFLVPASIIIASIVACFFVYLIVLRLKGYFPVFALVSREDSELIDVLIEAQGEIRGKE